MIVFAIIATLAVVAFSFLVIFGNASTTSQTRKGLGSLAFAWGVVALLWVIWLFD